MKKQKIKHRSNFYCRLAGWFDRLFRLIALAYDGIVVSSFIDSRKALFTNEASEAVDKAQSKVLKARTEADEIMAQLAEHDIALIANGATDVDEKRRRKQILRLFESLVAIRNDIKATYVNLHSDLDSSQAQIKRQLTAYLLAAFSRKKSVDIPKNATVNYKEMIVYKAYLTSYERADQAINEVVDSIVGVEALCNCLKEVVE